MKHFFVLLITLVSLSLLASCSQHDAIASQPVDRPTPTNTVSEEVKTNPNNARSLSTQTLNDDFNKAKNEGDHRLYATSGRSITFPGINAVYFDEVQNKCGKKYMSGTGDVISGNASSISEKRLQRKLLLDYMSTYNQQMLAVCRGVKE